MYKYVIVLFFVQLVHRYRNRKELNQSQTYYQNTFVCENCDIYPLSCFILTFHIVIQF